VLTLKQLTIYDYEKKYQPRFQAYLGYVGKNNANEVKMLDFINWISKHVLIFKNLKGMHDDERLNDKTHKEFTEYLKGVAKNESTKTI
jgi:hypothetical protein